MLLVELLQHDEIAEILTMSPQMADDKSVFSVNIRGWHALDNDLYRINFVLRGIEPSYINTSNALLIGATGVQGLPVVRALCPRLGAVKSLPNKMDCVIRSPSNLDLHPNNISRKSANPLCNR